MFALEEIARQLEARGYRVTPSRRAVIATILQQPHHFTVDDLFRRCRGVGRATLFRTVRLLSEIGAVCRVLMEDGSRHYAVSQREHHHHLICTACGQVQDLDECAIEGALRELSQSSGYAIDGHRLELYGRCRACHATAPTTGGRS